MNYKTMIEKIINKNNGSMILNNEIWGHIWDIGSYWILKSDIPNDDDAEVCEYYMIDKNSAHDFIEHTNEIIYYNDLLDIYLLGVTNCGTPWRIVNANWEEGKEID